MTADVTLLIVGLGLFSVGVLGGNISSKWVTIGTVSRISRVVCIPAGLIFIVVGIWMSIGHPDLKHKSDKSTQQSQADAKSQKTGSDSEKKEQTGKTSNCVESTSKTEELSPVPLRFSGHTYGSGGYEASIWTARAEAPGLISSVKNFKYSDPTNMHQLFWSDVTQRQSIAIEAKDVYQETANANPYYFGKTLVFVGTQNGGPSNKTITFTVEYTLPTPACP
jgi:hypothetical protein